MGLAILVDPIFTIKCLIEIIINPGINNNVAFSRDVAFSTLTFHSMPVIVAVSCVVICNQVFCSHGIRWLTAHCAILARFQRRHNHHERNVAISLVYLWSHCDRFQDRHSHGLATKDSLWSNSNSIGNLTNSQCDCCCKPTSASQLMKI